MNYNMVICLQGVRDWEEVGQEREKPTGQHPPQETRLLKLTPELNHAT